MIRRPLVLAMLVTGLMSASAFAQSNLSPKEQYTIDSQRASTRYADDKEICAEENNSSARLKCMRAAKSEYNQSLAQAKTKMKAGAAHRQAQYQQPQSQSQQAQHAICNECGKVLSVNMSEKAGEGSALGIITGGVAGALLGNQVGGGRGKDIATLAGAAGGAFAGNKVEQNMKSSKIWTVAVQYENGTQGSFDFNQDPGLSTGDRVKNVGGNLSRR